MKEKFERQTFSLTAQDKALLKALAEHENKTQSEFIKQIIRGIFNKYKKKDIEEYFKILDLFHKYYKTEQKEEPQQTKKEIEATTNPQAVDKQFILTETQNLMDYLDIPEETPERTFFNRIKNDKEQIINNIDLAAAKLESIYSKGIEKATIKDINEILFIITNGKEAPTEPLKETPKEEPKQKTEKMDTAANAVKNQELIKECINCINKFGTKTQQHKIKIIQKKVNIEEPIRIEDQIKKIYKYYEDHGKATNNGVNTLLALLGIYKD